ncbi:hypothetical protein CFC21_030517 [Triticum aestivum]|uniref:Uncharacterized protein n=2 Tax=Triticum aestivum TaxID=4565 RepID=A0A3B6DIZ4_WHEAT|nr:hypothetical protein CFC21_030517 [Triticum aestivum]
MDTTASNAVLVIEFQNIVNDVAAPRSPSPDPEAELMKRHFSREEAVGKFPLTAIPSILLHVLSSSDLDPKDLAALEANIVLPPDLELSLPELAALDMCQQRPMFNLMKPEEKEWLKQRCGGSWKLVLGYILVGEKNCRRGKSQVTAGPGHSIVVTASGAVYSFGMNSSGQLGLRDTEDKFKPCLIRSLQGIRITHAAVGSSRTMLVSDTGSVYVFGIDTFGVESLKGIFVVQATIGGLFSAVLSREGRVYTFSWGHEERLGHNTDYADVEPRLLSGPLENVLVAQIAAGNCYLLMLAYQPTGMSVYSVGCGQGGKLGHGNKNSEGVPQLIAHFAGIDARPVSISAGAWHAAVLSSDGRGVLAPKLVASLTGLNKRFVQISPTNAYDWHNRRTGVSHTVALTESGKVYAFGGGGSGQLGLKLAEGKEAMPPLQVDIDLA